MPTVYSNQTSKNNSRISRKERTECPHPPHDCGVGDQVWRTTSKIPQLSQVDLSAVSSTECEPGRHRVQRATVTRQPIEFARLDIDVAPSNLDIPGLGLRPVTMASPESVPDRYHDALSSDEHCLPDDTRTFQPQKGHNLAHGTMCYYKT
ncbi:MAG: hypothetical protein CV089_23600 [Nitrospira sp. WS110]|nr:hypothetical protein [Nitrospira sp. WS110]